MLPYPKNKALILGSRLIEKIKAGQASLEDIETIIPYITAGPLFDGIDFSDYTDSVNAMLLKKLEEYNRQNLDQNIINTLSYDNYSDVEKNFQALKQLLYSYLERHTPLNLKQLKLLGITFLDSCKDTNQKVEATEFILKLKEYAKEHKAKNTLEIKAVIFHYKNIF